MIITKNAHQCSVIKERLQIMAEKSTLHGFANFASANTAKWKRVLWLIFFLLNTSLFATLTSLDIAKYLSWPVKTLIRFTNERETEFPGVAICNANPFVTEQAAQSLLQITRNYTRNQTLGLKEMNTHLLDYNLRYFIANLVFYNYSVTVKKQFGLSFEKFMIYCEFANQPCNHRANWTWFYSWWNGNCYKFNNKAGLKEGMTDKKSGLSVELFAGHPEKNVPYNKASGFQIFIFNKTKYLKFDDYLPRILIPTGIEMNIDIKRRFIHKLPKPYSECDLDLRTADVNSVDSQFYREMFLTNSSYEKFFCLHRAYRKEVFEQCKCVVELSDVKEEAKICSTKEEQDCRIHIDTVLFQIRRFDGKYDEQCPLECNVNDFEMKMSSLTFPSYHYGNFLSKNNLNFKSSNDRKYDFRDVRKSVASINIYSSKVGHETLEEKETMMVINLFANSGAMLSIFLGMSLLSLVEGLQLLIEICVLVVSNLIVFKL